MSRTKRFTTLVADPGWKFGDKLPGKTRGASKRYRTQTVDQICAMSIPSMADDAILFLWRVSAMPQEALDVARAWGFTPKAELVWIKSSPGSSVGLAFGMGRYVRAAHETCIIATRGRAHTLIRDKAIRSVFFAPRGEHSEKPEEFYRIVERLVPGPYAELYGRRVREGWSVWGDELGRGKWHPGDRGVG